MKQKKRLLKGIFSILLCFMMVMGLMPNMTIPAYADGGTYLIYVGGTQVTETNKDNIPPTNGKSTGTASYDSGTNTLTLNNYTYTGEGYKLADSYAGIGWDISNADLNIVLEGENEIHITKNETVSVIYLYRGNNLKISGSSIDDKLVVKSNNINTGFNQGIVNGQAKSINISNCKLEVEVGDPQSGQDGYGIKATPFANGEININNANVTTKGKTAGLSGFSINIDNASTVTSIGDTQAVKGTVKTAANCKGWTDTVMTDPSTSIAMNSTSGVLFDSTSTYKAVEFTPSHVHNFSYSATGAAITATCTSDCNLPEKKVSLTLSAPTKTTYNDGNNAAATLDSTAWVAAGLVVPEIYYEGVSPTSYAKTTAAPANAGNYKATITVSGKTASLNYTIAKAEPNADDAPTASATYGQTLADVTLTNPNGNTPGTWTWESDGTTSVGSVGSHTFKAVFTPTDTANYKKKENVDVTVTVGKAANPATVADTAVVRKNRNTVDLAEYIDMRGATGTVSYAINGEANGCTLNGSVLTSGSDTGSITVDVSIAEDDNYLALATKHITVTITDKFTQTITAPDVTVAYGETGKRVSATTTGDGAISYAVKRGSEDYIDVDASTGELTTKRIGTATVIVTAAGTDTYEAAIKEVTVTITKATAVVTKAPEAKELVYDGSAQELVTSGTAENGTLHYALGTDDTAAPDDSAYSASIPTATEIGTYYVWYKAIASEDYLDSEPVCIVVTISKTKETAVVTKAPEAKKLVYNGSAQELVTSGTAENGTLHYALGTDDTTAPDDSAYSASIPTATEIGTYYVWYKAIASEDYLDSEPVCIVVTISKEAEPEQKNVLVVKNKTRITNLFSKYGESGYKYKFKVEDKSQRKIASVTKKGKISVKKVGSVKVSLFRKAKKGKWEKVEEQTVKTELPAVTKRITNLKVGDTLEASSFITNQSELLNKPTSYESTNKKVATVDSTTGKITILKKGKTRIRIIYGTGDGSAVYTTRLMVK